MATPSHVVAIIPARGGSKRVPRKNLADVGGIPLVAWTIRAALGSRWLGPGNVYVSTDDTEVAETAEAFGAVALVRPPELASDTAWTEPVIQHAVLAIEAAHGPVGLVVWLNACVPQLRSADIDAAITLLHDRGLREVVAVDRTGVSNSAVRVLRRETLFQQRLSVKFGVIAFPYQDVNTLEDLDVVRQILVDGGTPAGDVE